MNAESVRRSLTLKRNSSPFRIEWVIPGASNCIIEVDHRGERGEVSMKGTII